MRRHPLVAYFVIAYVVSWLGVSPLVAAGLGLVRWNVPHQLHVLGALGPLVGAIVVTAVVGGRAGLTDLLRRATAWRVGGWWWLLAAGSPFALWGAAVLLLRARGAPWPDFGMLPLAARQPGWLYHVGVAALAYGIFEEIGWRGFALPRLQARFSALSATLILALLWGLWHTPYFTYLYRFQGAAAWLGFAACFVAGAVWLTFLYNGAGGSTLMPIVWHVAWNVVNVGAVPMSMNAVMLTNSLVIALAIVALLVGGAARLSPTGKFALSDRPASAPRGIPMAV